MSWIKLHRDLLESSVFAHPTTLKIWIWLLLKAKHKDCFVCLNNGRGTTDIPLKRGQILFGRFKAEEELSINGSTIYKQLQKLQELGNISIESNNQYSIITICKYVEYQSGEIEKEQHSNNTVTTKEQHRNNTVTHIKNVNNVKNEQEKWQIGFIFFLDELQIEGEVFSDGIRYGNHHERLNGGLSEMAIKKHCKEKKIEYVE